MEIRKAMEREIPGIVILWEKLMASHRGLNPLFELAPTASTAFSNYITSLIASDNHLLVVCLEGKTAVGYGLAFIAENPPVFKNVKYCMVDDIFLEEKFRGQGLGRKMFEFIMAWMRGKGVSRLELSVAEGNDKAMAFYKALHFRDYLHRLYLEI
jgi:GNAT superfamily N-acetyltransferase